MYFPRSLLAYAILLSFSSDVDAAVAQHRVASGFVVPSAQEKDGHSGPLSRLQTLFAKRQQPALVWWETASYRILRDGSPEDTQEVCNKLIGPLDPTTVTVDYTPAALYMSFPIQKTLDMKLANNTAPDTIQEPLL
ncbi:uncharacterized protein EI97DRAFT_264607 [Westerdykella ornata]|uniref:Uncharacterized protein n=1 Tax=Westerdykella ornata TaxID=318751 RepID=A0A6A6J7D6_WESOR|nr:uncharacterized protein EI97DRAFT_264607 [Westerdykella ornata]KAF2271556.1 hypothetical protein EI97DRAFT_264607 [Westerdykella ornata]